MSDKQQLAIQSIREGKNVCLASAAGTGKSWTINQVKTDNSVIICPTAVAATNVGGMTAHSAFSLSHGLQTDKDKDRITPNMMTLFAKESPIDMLIFDEGFNLRADLFDVIDYKLRKIRGSEEPFGGLQVVIAGDCSQNEPIVSYQEKKIFRTKYISPFIFHSKVWKELELEVFVFDKIYRNDNLEQQVMLNAIRMKDNTIWEGCEKPAWQVAVDYINDVAKHGVDDGSDLFLTTYREDSESINQQHYRAIRGEEFSYKAVMTGKFKAKDAIVPEVLKLKVGAKVMFVVNNYELGFYNGTIGTIAALQPNLIVVETDDNIIELSERHEWESVKYNNLMGSITKVPQGTMRQFPLMLAYSATISKVQGCTLTSATVDFGDNCFGNGMSYVALSRLTDLKNLTLVRPLEYDDVKVNSKAIKFIKKYE